MSNSIRGARALVTGGAGFVGSHIVDHLLAAGAERIVVIDNLVRGRHENLDDAHAQPARSSSSRATSATPPSSTARRHGWTSSSTRRPCASPTAPRSRRARSR